MLSLLIFSLLAVFTFIIVLSPPSAGSTPSDASQALDLYPQFEDTTLGFQSDTAVFDASLLLEVPFLSAATDSGLGHPPTTTTSKEGFTDVRLLEEPPSGKSLDVLDSDFDSSLASIDLGEIVSIAAGGVLPSDIDPVIVALSTSAFEQAYNLTVPTSDHAEIPVASLSDLLVDPDVVDKSSLRNRYDLLAPIRYRSPVASSRSSSQLPDFTAARIPSKAGDVITVHPFHVLTGSITASNMSSPSDRADITLWVLAQSHRVSSEFVFLRRREHPAVDGVINYHLFRFMVPLSLHHKLKAHVENLQKMLNERQTDCYIG